VDAEGKEATTNTISAALSEEQVIEGGLETVMEIPTAEPLFLRPIEWPKGGARALTSTRHTIPRAETV
jgi:hypothetical protein